MSPEYARMRQLVVDAVRANPAVEIVDPELLAALDDAGADCTFEALGFDSLARMELSIWLQLEAGITIGESEVMSHPSVDALATYLAARPA